jgi:pimeloyl-ACP methyl ester carboxylesterase
MTTTRTLETSDATLTYDVRGDLPPADGRPPLLMVAQPMDASGFGTLASHFGDRTVVTYDPRGLGRSTRTDGRTDHDPEQQADDLHHLIEALDAGPVELFASSGGAVTALALVAAHPADVTTLVAHEPPLLSILPDADRAFAAERDVQAAYQQGGFGAGLAAFIALTSWQGEFTVAFASQPAPDPAQFGLPTHDDGSRDDPLLSGSSNAVTAYRPDFDAVAAAPTRVVIAAGIESQGTLTGRTAEAAAEALGQPVTIFPSHHGGFLGGEFGQRGGSGRLHRTRHREPAGASRPGAEVNSVASRGCEDDAIAGCGVVGDGKRLPWRLQHEPDGFEHITRVIAAGLGSLLRNRPEVVPVRLQRGHERGRHALRIPRCSSLYPLESSARICR